MTRASGTPIKVLITGATGFLGARLFSLLNQVGTYKLFVGARDFQSLDRIFDIKPDQKRFFRLDQASTMSTALDGVDVVIHLAALGHRDCEKDPLAAQACNVDAVRALMVASLQKGVRQFIYLSTFHVYGKNAQGLITEQTQPQPMNSYALTHLLAEHEILKAPGAIQKTIIRLSNSFGLPLIESPSAWALVANDFCLQAMRDHKIVIQSSGHQRKDFVSSKNLFACIDFLLEHPDVDGVFNLGSGRTLSLLDLAKCIRKICRAEFQRDVEIEVLGDQPTAKSQVDFIYSSEKILTRGFQMSQSVEEGLKELLEEIQKVQNFKS